MDFICSSYDNVSLSFDSNNNITEHYIVYEISNAIGQVGMTSLQVNSSLAEVNASVFIAVF